MFINVYLRDRITGDSGVYEMPYDYSEGVKEEDVIRSGYDNKREYIIDSVRFSFEENDYNCDCNRSLFLYRDTLNKEFNKDEFKCNTNRIIIDKIVDRKTGDIIYAESDDPLSEDYIGEAVSIENVR